METNIVIKVPQTPTGWTPELCVKQGAVFRTQFRYLQKKNPCMPSLNWHELMKKKLWILAYRSQRLHEASFWAESLAKPPSISVFWEQFGHYKSYTLLELNLQSISPKKKSSTINLRGLEPTAPKAQKLTIYQQKCNLMVKLCPNFGIFFGFFLVDILKALLPPNMPNKFSSPTAVSVGPQQIFRDGDKWRFGVVDTKMEPM